MVLEEFISSGIFRYGVFPVLSAGAGILLKCVTRNDQYAFFKKEDMAVGPQLMLTSALAFVVITTDRARSLVQANAHLSEALAETPADQERVSGLQATAYGLSQTMTGSAWLLLLLILSLWGVTTIIKRWGWQTEAEMNPVIGIAFPLGMGVFSLITVMLAAQP